MKKLAKHKSKSISGKKPVEYKLDLGCGQSKREGFTGIDIVKLPGVDIQHDLLDNPWPIPAGSVTEVWCSHYFEHVPGKLRGKWMDELYRVLKPGAQATIIVPYYASMRAIQDFTHEWPPVSEASFLYFNKGWREQNRLAHYPVICNFDFTYGYSLSPMWATRAEDARNFGLVHYLNVVLDLQVVLTKRV